MLRRALAGFALIMAAACSSGGEDAAAQTFCERLDRLTTNDPFRSLGDTATPDEMEVAFHALVERGRELVDAAPPEAKGSARDFAEASEEMDELMADAGYDGADLDQRAYRDAQLRYADASRRLLAHLDASCDASDR